MSQSGPAGFTIPPAIATRADFSRVMRELERVDNDLEAQKARAGGGVGSAAGHAVQYLLPSMSKGLNDFLEMNKIALGNDKARMELREQMRRLKDHAPVVQMTFAADVDPETLTWLASWTRQNLHPQALLQVGLQPGLVGGVYIRTPNHVYDFSLRGRLREKRGAIREALDAALARQTQAAPVAEPASQPQEAAA